MSIKEIIIIKEKLKELEKDSLLELALKINALKKEQEEAKLSSINKLIALLNNADEELIKELEDVIIDFFKKKNIL
ncbi:hypothetical protein [Fusobacterium gastrosuis]|uniref:hypothetical protein n=1 Tax=Fusobacterium gastrosuis TaxID=1755100 RepID=UPI0029702A68|nr:hypothetical protein [Fusobacteriaceae bacterium]MDY5714275.1 hypothetical protein [Fusobacterium gastrosuis]